MSTTIDAERPRAGIVERRSATETITVTQYSRRAILAVWAAAAVPMGALAWIVVPALAGGGTTSLARALIVCLTAGLVWQFALVVALVGYEQRSLRWSRVREALWLRAPRSPHTGRVGGRVWLVVVPALAGVALAQLIPSVPHPMGRDFGEFLSSSAGTTMLHGSWGWFALLVTGFVFNTVLGEELLFRGLLLPRMHGAFGDRDWIANGVLFATYHLHVPWAIPGALLDTFFVVYPTKRYRSAWIGILVHSAQSVFFTVLLLTIVL